MLSYFPLSFVVTGRCVDKDSPDQVSKTDNQKHSDGMISVLASNTVFRGLEPRSGQSKDYEMVFVASPLSTQY